MQWIDFSYYAIITMVSWGVATITLSWLLVNKLLEKTSPKALTLLSHISILIGIAYMIFFVIHLWLALERPPIRTLGETRLWYTIFLSIVTYLIYLRWKYELVMLFGLMMSMLFLLVNLLNPETYSKTLMPALQSPWFIPHVIVYILSYALLGLSWIMALIALVLLYKDKFKDWMMKLADDLVYIGFAFLTLGLVFGALWAKEAWGHYWTWDPKETWALLTWLLYLLYIHFRYFHLSKEKLALWILVLSFIILLICWFGINYLPSAQNSVHTYTS